MLFILLFKSVSIWCLFFFFNYLFIYFWLCWVFVSMRGLSPVAESGGHSSSRCAGLSPSRPLLLRSTGSRRAGSVIVAHGPSCSAACGIFPDEGSNPCPLHWQADSQPPRHQGSPIWCLFSLAWRTFSYDFFHTIVLLGKILSAFSDLKRSLFHLQFWKVVFWRIFSKAIVLRYIFEGICIPSKL